MGSIRNMGDKLSKVGLILGLSGVLAISEPEISYAEDSNDNSNAGYLSRIKKLEKRIIELEEYRRYTFVRPKGNLSGQAQGNFNQRGYYGPSFSYGGYGLPLGRGYFGIPFGGGIGFGHFGRGHHGGGHFGRGHHGGGHYGGGHFGRGHHGRGHFGGGHHGRGHHGGGHHGGGHH